MSVMIGRVQLSVRIIARPTIARERSFRTHPNATEIFQHAAVMRRIEEERRNVASSVVSVFGSLPHPR